MFLPTKSHFSPWGLQTPFISSAGSLPLSTFLSRCPGGCRQQGRADTNHGWMVAFLCMHPKSQPSDSRKHGLSSVHAGWPWTPLSSLRPGKCSISRRRLSPAASGWAGSHPGITSDLCRGYRGWLWLASALQTAHGRVNNALHPPRMQPPASLGGPRAAPETFLLEAEKTPSSHCIIYSAAL